MSVADITEAEAYIEQDHNFDVQQAVLAMQPLSLSDQADYILSLSLRQANSVLAETPFKQVQAIIEQLEDNDQEVRARQLSMGLGLISGEVEPAGEYLDNSVLSHVRERIGWIVGLALMGIVSGLIISQYENALSSLVLLAVYMPVVAAAGGNTGSQTATLVVRALATGDISLNDWAKVLWKEFQVAMIMAVVLAAVIMGRVVIFSGNHPLPNNLELNSVGFAIGLAISIQVVISTTLGGLLPMVARSLRLDPAVLVSPVLASVVDISGMLIYFYTVTKLLGI